MTGIVGCNHANTRDMQECVLNITPGARLPTRMRILLAMSDQAVARPLGELLQLEGYEVMHAYERQLALRLAVWQHPDVILLEAQLADGMALCESLTCDNSHERPSIIIIGGSDDEGEQIRWIEAGADSYHSTSDSHRVLEARLRALLQKRRNHQAFEPVERTVMALWQMIAAKDQATAEHLRRMADYALLIGRHLKLDDDDLTMLRYSALLHDIGKIGVSDAVLRKPGHLSADERRQIEQHPIIGEQIVRELYLGARIGLIIRHHHERWDGRGYPDGLAGLAIPIGARIVAALDAFDAMTTDRTYTRACSRSIALRCLRVGAGEQWDSAIVDALVACLPSERQREPAERTIRVRLQAAIRSRIHRNEQLVAVEQ